MEDLQQELSNVDISMVIPVYNAGGHIDNTVKTVLENFKAMDLSFELILVDDGSLDNTWDLLKKIKDQHPNLVIIRLTRNFGQHNATICGIKYVTGNYVVTMDDDLEDDPSLVSDLYNKIHKGNYDLVYGMNDKKKKSITRRLLTGVYKKLTKLDGIDKGKGSSYRIMTRDLAVNIQKSSNQFLFIDEICLWYTKNIEYIHYNSQCSKVKSRYRKKDLFGLAGNVIMFSSTLPLRLVTVIGFSMVFVNFVLGTYYIIRKFIHDVPAGYTSILISVLFGTGLILMALGIIGEYVGKMLKLLNNAPVYEIREKQ